MAGRNIIADLPESCSFSGIDYSPGLALYKSNYQRGGTGRPIEASRICIIFINKRCLSITPGVRANCSYSPSVNTRPAVLLPLYALRARSFVFSLPSSPSSPSPGEHFFSPSFFLRSNNEYSGQERIYAREKHSLVLYSVIAFRMHRFVDSLIRRPFDFNSISASAWRVCLAFGNRPCTNLIDFGPRARRW